MSDSQYQSPPPPPPPGGYQGGGYGGYQGGPPPPRPTNVLSILALVAGVIAFFTGLVPVLGLLLGLVAVVLGVVGLRKARTLMGSGKGLSITGIVLGAVAAVTSLISATVVGGVLNAASDAASSAASSAAAPGPAPSSPEQSSAPAPGQSSAAQPPAQGQFPGQTADDQVAPAGSPIAINGLTITTTPLAAQTTVLGNYWCTSVTYQNGGSDQAPYNLFDWKVLNPSGASESATLTGQDGALSSGELAPGGTVTGSICFNDSSVQPGQNVVLYEVTSLFSNDRGAWLNSIS